MSLKPKASVNQTLIIRGIIGPRAYDSECIRSDPVDDSPRGLINLQPRANQIQKFPKSLL
jgi:hypothetical protein